jgi:type IV pilus assembly protein PilB
MAIDDEIRSLAVGRASAERIAEVATASGMRRLREEGVAKARTGLTSFAELARVTG